MPERPTSWQTFLRAHWGAIAGADFFTTEVWTWRGVVTYYTVFVIDLASRRVQIVGSTPSPNDLFMRQVGRTLTAADDGVLSSHRVLICDRDARWSVPVRGHLREAGLRVVQTPFQAPNANGVIDPFIGSVGRECLDHVFIFTAAGLQRLLKGYVEYYEHSWTHLALDKDTPVSRGLDIGRRQSPRHSTGRRASSSI